VTYDATASASPTVKTVGTFLGDTLTASCSIPAAGEAQLNLFITTSNGAWNADILQIDSTNGAPGTPVATKVDFPVGGLPANNQIGFEEANAGGHESDNQLQLIQLAPSTGSLTIHQTASTFGGAQACHMSVQSFPETRTAVTG
jgi:hypothetical protein